MDVSMPVAAAELPGAADPAALLPLFALFPPLQPARSASVSTEAAAVEARLPILLVII
ncbi:hypothetical protein D3C81_1238060 [compost metagenome]